MNEKKVGRNKLDSNNFRDNFVCFGDPSRQQNVFTLGQHKRVSHNIPWQGYHAGRESQPQIQINYTLPTHHFLIGKISPKLQFKNLKLCDFARFQSPKVMENFVKIDGFLYLVFNVQHMLYMFWGLMDILGNVRVIEY